VDTRPEIELLAVSTIKHLCLNTGAADAIVRHSINMETLSRLQTVHTVRYTSVQSSAVRKADAFSGRRLGHQRRKEPGRSPVALSGSLDDCQGEIPSPMEEGFPVQLRVYNIDRWGLAPVGGKLLRKEVDGIYHVAVAVHGREFWFDHEVEELDLKDVHFVRGFSPAFLYDMGTTSVGLEEVREFCFGPMKEKYNIDTYDVFYHNCHHFARDVCLFLTNKPIPQWLIDHGEQGLSELTEENAKLVRTVSNKIARIMMVSWGRYEKKRWARPIST